MALNMLQIFFIILPIYSTITSAACGPWSCISLFQPYFRPATTKKVGASSFAMVLAGSSEKQVSQSSLQSTQSALESKVMRNLKTVPVKEDGALLARWNELKGLSEKELIVSSSSSILKDERSEIALGLAYRRCEYVTQLFSKTFYMGTSLMRPDARAHVWAIYAWCRRTDDIVDSPRALLNREVLNKDLEDWSLRLDKIWAGNYDPQFILCWFAYLSHIMHTGFVLVSKPILSCITAGTPMDLFDLAMVDTLRAYPRLSIQPFRDMIAGKSLSILWCNQTHLRIYAPSEHITAQQTSWCYL